MVTGQFACIFLKLDGCGGWEILMDRARALPLPHRWGSHVGVINNLVIVPAV